MRYPLKFLQRVGLVSTLLIGGVLGGLMAPLPSEAVPELTLQIDSLPATVSGTLTGTSILGSSVACNQADVGLGYTACYSILTSATTVYAGSAPNGTTRYYKVQNAPNTTARLRVGDNLGQDNFSLVGVQFVPANSAGTTVTTYSNSPDFNTNEQHTLTIKMRNKFNSIVNVNNATGVVVGSTTVGQVAFGIASGGEFRSAPLATLPATTPLFCGTATTAQPTGNAKCNTVGDSVTLTGTGIFKGTAAVPILSPGSADSPPKNNSQPLNFLVLSPTNSIVGYDGLSNPKVGQVDQFFPKFDCIDNQTPATTKCQPDITLTLTATMKGPDTFVMLNGGADGFCAICNFASDNAQLTRLFTFLTKVVAFLDWWENSHADNPRLRAIIEKAQVFLATFNAPSLDQDCPGAKFVKSQLTYEGLKSQVTLALHGGVLAEPAQLSHEYKVVNLPGKTWAEARAAAQALDGGGAGWDLATITSAAEQAIISGQLGLPPSADGPVHQYWIGGEQLPISVSPDVFDEPGGNWQWINGEGMFWNGVAIVGQYQNWGGPSPDQEPNNCCGGQNHLTLDNRYDRPELGVGHNGWGWDDNDQFLSDNKGYIAERVVVSAPIL